MRLEDFDYHLPAAAIAQYAAPRGASRLLDVRHSARRRHRRIAELAELLDPGDLLVVNDSKVLPVRLRAQLATGGRVEILLLRQLEATTWEALLRPGRRAREGTRLCLPGELRAEVLGRWQDRYRLRFSTPPLPLLERIGEVPLPPYVKRAVEPGDRERYQTIFASHPGSIAAPTAGLHFDQRLLNALDRRGIERVAVTLHVGAATFRPITARDPRRHRLEPETCQLREAAAAAITAAQRRGGRVVAVGTTVVRALESAALPGGGCAAGEREADLFILPGFRFRVVDLLLTNFHLPRSTLLMLVCALAGRERILGAYRTAIAAGYRFYSYGDAMLVDREERNRKATTGEMEQAPVADPDGEEPVGNPR